MREDSTPHQTVHSAKVDKRPAQLLACAATQKARGQCCAEVLSPRKPEPEGHCGLETGGEAGLDWQRGGWEAKQWGHWVGKGTASRQPCCKSETPAWLTTVMFSLKSGAQAQTDPGSETYVWGGGTAISCNMADGKSLRGRCPFGSKGFLPHLPGCRELAPSSRVLLGTWELSQGRRVNWAKVTPSSRGSPHPVTETHYRGMKT